LSAPRIKLYLLQPGYSEDTDNDLRSRQMDELLPVVRKPILLSEAQLLDGIIPVEAGLLQPVDVGGGRQTFNLIPPSGDEQYADGATIALIDAWDGNLELIVYDDNDDPISHDNYTVVHGSGIKFNDGFAPPYAGTVSAYLQDTTPATQWALIGEDYYDGDNTSWNRIIVSIDGGPYELAEPNDGYITISAADSVRGTYAIRRTVARAFIGPKCNWVVDHMNLWPDVFVGTQDYPGDGSLVDGVPVEPGVVPKYRNHETYQLRARDGMVVFPEAVDSEATAVKANYSYYASTANVTTQSMDHMGGWLYKASSENAFPGSHNMRWVRRNSPTMPLNVYVNGTRVPIRRTYLPFDPLTIKIS